MHTHKPCIHLSCFYFFGIAKCCFRLIWRSFLLLRRALPSPCLALVVENALGTAANQTTGGIEMETLPEMAQRAEFPDTPNIRHQSAVQNESRINLVGEDSSHLKFRLAQTPAKHIYNTVHGIWSHSYKCKQQARGNQCLGAWVPQKW